MSDSSGAESPISSGNESQANSPALSPTAPAKHRVKIDGSEIELTTEDLIRDYQLRQASNKRFQEASQKEKRAQPVLEALEKKEFRKLLEHVPKGDFKKFAEEFLLEEIEYEELPDYEKRRMAAEARAQKLEAELKRRDELTNKEKSDRELEQAAMDVDTEIASVLDQMGRPPTPYLVVRIIDEMLARHEATGERYPAAKAYERANKRLDEDMTAYLEDMSEADLVKRLSPQKMDAVRKHLLSQVGMLPPKRTQAPATQRTREAPKPTSIDDAFAQLEARFSGKKGVRK